MVDLNTLDAKLHSTLGLMVWNGLATAYPDLVTKLNDLYTSKVGALGFLPIGWASDAVAANGVDGNIVLPAPAFDAKGQYALNLPAWLDDDAARDAWQNLHDRFNDAIMQYAAFDAANGAARLDQLRADANFWDITYRAANVIGQFAGKAKNEISNIVGGSKLVVYGVLGLAAFAGLWWLVNQGKRR